MVDIATSFGRGFKVVNVTVASMDKRKEIKEILEKEEVFRKVVLWTDYFYLKSLRREIWAQSR